VLHPLDRLTPQSLRRLHREGAVGRAAVRSLLERLRASGTPLASGINRRNDPRTARVERVGAERVQLRIRDFDHAAGAQLFLSFELDGTRYFFAASPLESPASDRLAIALPEAIFQAERRDLERAAAEPARVELRAEGDARWLGRVVDRSLHGLGLELPASATGALPERLRARFLDGERAGEELHARVCHRRPGPDGWTRVGLSLSHVAAGEPIPIERRSRILQQPASARARDAALLARAAVRSARARLGLRRPAPAPPVPVVEYPNGKGQPIRAIVDSTGDPRGAPAVVIPPAWGRTKETLWPLAATLLATFERAGEPLVVVRFDGANRRGESHVDPECRAPGDEYLHFTFSQAVRDIHATLDFLEAAPGFGPRTAILVTASLACVEGRRALAAERRGRLGGWVAAVGMVDLQSALRTISGGVDYGYGLLRGIRFGRHELVGVVADMDHTGLDAIEHGMGFLEDARRDFAAIEVPITWIHGRHDAWMDLERVREALSCGDTSRRRLIEVPTGHQLRTSREALETFLLISEEVSEMALGRRLAGALPDLAALERRRTAERARLPRGPANLRAFWADYLLGRDRELGMELLTATAAYRNFLEAQIRLLDLAPGARIADLGSGTGDFPLQLARRPGLAPGLRVDALDYVPEALRRGRERLCARGAAEAVRVERIVADLDAPGIALADGRYDAALASLVVGYLRDPERFLRELARILRPGGRLVVSSLRRDADISLLFLDGMAELSAPEARAELGEAARRRFDALARDFLNDAARLLDLEEQGRLRFFDADELRALVARAGFVDLVVEPTFGEPEQAFVVAARRP
jgi:ubiquinone/menaquinone biosynthesis C-methylase UbiE